VTSMPILEGPEPSAEVQRQLEMANSQLALYVRDLKRLADAERQKARELAAANARLQILARLKTDFLTFISHELRTPLFAMTAVDMLDPHSDPKEQAEVIGLIRSGYERLEGFIQKGLEYFDWLAIPRLATATTMELTRVVRWVVDTIPGLAEPGVDFQIFSSGVPYHVRGEEEDLARVVRILLDNALKFSQQVKSIKLRLHATMEKVTLTIADRGQGFPPELAQEIFRPFTIADVLHHSQGTGLNLALASAIVEAYGGRMRAESAGVGKGATFIVELAAVLPADETEQ
jgi:signal transduction histidine kinase